MAGNPTATKCIMALTSTRNLRIMKTNRPRWEPYVRFAVPHITTILLVFHLGMGCCLHHAHECVKNCCESPGPVAESCPCDSHSSHKEDDVSFGGLALGGARDHSPHRHDCEGEQCSFVAASEPGPREKGDSNLVLNAPNDPLLCPEAGHDLACRVRTAERPMRPLLRAHLLLSILLI